MNEHRYEQRGDMYTHRVYGDVGNHYSILEDTSGAVATAAPWLASVVDLAKLANANLADPPNVLVWFRAVGTDLINFKFFKDQVYVAPQEAPESAATNRRTN